MKQTRTELLTTVHDRIAVIQMNRKVATNPMNELMNGQIIDEFSRCEADGDIDAVVLTGGVGRSFCAGGDFNEVQHLDSYASVEAWIDRTIALYMAPATLSKPVIAAIDGYAIGIGFQLALSCDIRIVTNQATFLMPELKHGISCTIGSYMLNRCVGRLRMQEIVLGCAPINAEKSLECALSNAVVDVPDLIRAALETARLFARYPRIPFANTKKVMNKEFISGLANIAKESKSAHAESFAAKTAQAHMQKILKTSC